MIKSPYATRFTLYGERDMSNRKPFRNRRDRAEARQNAVRNTSGHYTSHTRRNYHPSPPFTPSKAQERHYRRFVADCD
jgi:hypothetical protein